MKRQLLFTFAVILALILGMYQSERARRGAAPAATTASGGENAGGRAAGVSEFHPAWPYTPPPGGHFNTYVSDGFALGIYQALMEPPLFMYKWADGTWIPVAGNRSVLER